VECSVRVESSGQQHLGDQRRELSGGRVSAGEFAYSQLRKRRVVQHEDALGQQRLLSCSCFHCCCCWWWWFYDDWGFESLRLASHDFFLFEFATVEQSWCAFPKMLPHRVREAAHIRSPPSRLFAVCRLALWTLAENPQEGAFVPLFFAHRLIPILIFSAKQSCSVSAGLRGSQRHTARLVFCYWQQGLPDNALFHHTFIFFP